MRQAWESQASNWAAFARTPGHDNSHADINLPALLDLLPAPGALSALGATAAPDRWTLDLGCGEGRLGRVLNTLGHRVVGVDAAPTMVQLAVSHELPVPAVLGDAAALPFRDGMFDLVVAYMCLHDMDDMPRAVAEAARVLRYEGLLCAAIPHPLNSAGSFQGGEADAAFVITGSYFDPAPDTWVSDRDGIRMTFHSEHRPLQAYSQAMEDAGLLIEAIREVRPPDPPVSDAGSLVSDAERRWRRIPLFLHVRAVKPHR